MLFHYFLHVCFYNACSTEIFLYLLPFQKNGDGEEDNDDDGSDKDVGDNGKNSDITCVGEGNNHILRSCISLMEI